MTLPDSLRREIDAWSRSGLIPKIWWRDDDAVTLTPALHRLLALARNTGLTVALAAIPERIDRSLVEVAKSAGCPIWQHGWSHHFHHDGEFGPSRPLEQMLADAARGREALDEVVGPAGWQRVFVPPNHQLSMAFKSMITGSGYLGVSAGEPLTPPLEGINEVNAEIDVMDWPAGHALPIEVLCDRLESALQSRRTSDVQSDLPIGILTHHLAFGESDWKCVSNLVEGLASAEAVSFLRADEIFAPAPLRLPERRPLVTIVVTSCGRQDLLERTLDSLIKHNTYPHCEFVVIEDGDGARNRALTDRYHGLKFQWLETKQRVGQVAAIDAAYAVVQTEYIFHCEDDWEFYAPGFIEKSLAILERNPFVLQVWLRSLNDTNNHPVLAPPLFADGIPYRLLQPEHDTREWGRWHGFSWNPGLRRRRDYESIHSFTALNPLRAMKSFEVEREAGAAYRRLGLFAAILADNNGEGYVRHLGWDRRVVDPPAIAE